MTFAAERSCYSADERHVVAAMWRSIVDQCNGLSALVLASPDRPVGYAICTIVSDETAAALQSCRIPFLGRWALSRWSSGHSPSLTRAETVAANAGDGVNAVVLSLGFADSPDTKEGERARLELGSALIARHRGLNLRSITIEVFEAEADEFAALGFSVLRYPPAVLRASGIQTHGRPSLAYARRHDIGRSSNVALRALFRSYDPPQFAFTFEEQRLLTLALEDCTDIVLANRLGLSLSMVKRRFQGIYEKVDDAIGPASPLDHERGRSEGRRGSEMRRHLLAYLRSHPQELSISAAPRVESACDSRDFTNERPARATA